MPSNASAVQAMTSTGSFCPSDAIGASSTSETQFTISSQPIILALPGANKLYNKPFTVRMWGRVASASTPNLTLKMNYGTSSTVASNTNFASSGAIACTAAGNFYFEATMIWDSTNQKFNGTMRGWNCGTVLADTTLTAVTVPGVANSTEGLGITFTATFSGSNAANKAILDGAELEVL